MQSVGAMEASLARRGAARWALTVIVAVSAAWLLTGVPAASAAGICSGGCGNGNGNAQPGITSIDPGGAVCPGSVIELVGNDFSDTTEVAYFSGSGPGGAADFIPGSFYFTNNPDSANVNVPLDAYSTADGAGYVWVSLSLGSSVELPLLPIGQCYPCPLPVKGFVLTPYFDGANCQLGKVPALAGTPFTWDNSYYVYATGNPTNECPYVGQWDTAHCYIGTAPAGTAAFIWAGDYLYYTNRFGYE